MAAAQRAPCCHIRRQRRLHQRHRHAGARWRAPNMKSGGVCLQCRKWWCVPHQRSARCSCPPAAATAAGNGITHSRMQILLHLNPSAHLLVLPMPAHAAGRLGGRLISPRTECTHAI